MSWKSEVGEAMVLAPRVHSQLETLMTQLILRIAQHWNLHAGSPYRHMEEPITVYSFEVWDQTQGAYIAQRLKSPA
jgi:hypothetical protein